MTVPLSLTVEERRFFRDQLRDARSTALLDAEGYHPIVTALERLGSALDPTHNGLGQFQDVLLEVTREAWADDEAGDACASAEVLFTAVRNGRNEAVHQGVYARHLVRHCVELALLIEEGLMAGSQRVSDFMVRGAVCVEPWHQVGFARQQMLTNSFSYLPIFVEGAWKMVSDHAVASYRANSAKPREALRQRIAVAARDALFLEPAVVVGPETPVPEAIKVSRGKPVLIVEEEHLIGIATPFDFL